MSALAENATDAAKRPQYKDYVSFLGSYRKEEADGSTSASRPKNAFRDYLEQYNAKRYGPVRPCLAKDQPRTVVRTEAYIEIKAPGEPPATNVSKVSRLFEKKHHEDGKSRQECCSNLDRKASSTVVGEKAKRFEQESNEGDPNKRDANEAARMCVPPPPPPPAQPAAKDRRPAAAAAAAVDRNDPRLRRMVYGVLRGMYGAYHDKANDYIATLPRNRVRKNNGLDGIIDSIASQGGLEKLNGRVNPTVENE